MRRWESLRPLAGGFCGRAALSAVLRGLAWIAVTLFMAIGVIGALITLTVLFGL